MLEIKNEREFNKALKAFMKVVPEMQVDILKKISFDAYKKLQSYTPEDTRRAKGGWNTVVDGPPSEWKPPIGQGSYSEQPFSGMEKIKFNSVINLSNNVEYIIPLNEGHSGQRPEGITNPVMVLLIAHLARLLAVANRRRFP